MSELRNHIEFVRGVTYKKVDSSKEKISGYIPILRANNIVNNTIVLDDIVYVSSDLVKQKQLLKKNDIVITMSSGSKAHIGKTAIVSNDIIAGFGAFCGKIISNSIDAKYLAYIFQSPRFRKHIETICKGTNINNLKQEHILEFCVDVPPLEEQQRIVTRIEEMFSELDNAVATLKETKQKLAVYRQAVLKEAYDCNGDIVEISEIVDDIRIGPFGTMLHKEDYVDNGIPVVNPQHIKNGTIVANSKNTISQDKADSLSSYMLKTNDIVMGRRGEMGRTAPITDKENGWICGTGSILFRLKPEYDAVFYSQILSSPNIVKYLEENATGTTMKNLNEKIVKHIPVPNITVSMQNDINDKLAKAQSVIESIEKTIDTALQQSEALRQSILKKAFEGGL